MTAAGATNRYDLCPLWETLPTFPVTPAIPAIGGCGVRSSTVTGVFGVCRRSGNATSAADGRAACNHCLLPAGHDRAITEGAVQDHAALRLQLARFCLDLSYEARPFRPDNDEHRARGRRVAPTRSLLPSEYPAPAAARLGTTTAARRRATATGIDPCRSEGISRSHASRHVRRSLRGGSGWGGSRPRRSG